MNITWKPAKHDPATLTGAVPTVLLSLLREFDPSHTPPTLKPQFGAAGGTYYSLTNARYKGKGSTLDISVYVYASGTLRVIIQTGGLATLAKGTIEQGARKALQKHFGGQSL